MTTDQKYEYLINNDICTEEEMQLVTAIDEEILKPL